MQFNYLSHRFRTKDSGTQYRTLFQVLHLDLPLIFGLLILVGFSVIILYSAADQSMDMVWQKIGHVLAGLSLMFVLAQLPPAFYKRIALPLFILMGMLLIAVLIMGHIGGGGRRWLGVLFFRFQPSEMMKLILPMALAAYFAERELPPSFKEVGIALCLIIFPAILIAKQPDLGTAIVLLMGGVGVLLFAGIKWRWVILSLVLISIALPFLWHFLHAYQQERLLIFFNPEQDPLGAGYNIIQSKIAVGSGGLFGKGWLEGTQSHLDFLPVHTTDFIFAVCGEEFGFVGSLFLLGIYLYITSRCLYIASLAQDTFARLLSGGLSLIFFFSIFVNMGMVLGILPVVGLPLLLVSYGGSSVLTTFAIFGILMSIHCHRVLVPQ